MPSPVASVPEFAQAASRAGQLPDADELVAKFLESGRHPSDVDAFRRALVARGKLTEFQSLLVARGRDEGFRVAGYTILDRIGRGQSATVYRARHPLGQVVALKVLAPAKSRDGLARARFEREGELLAQCDHPHVVLPEFRDWLSAQAPGATAGPTDVYSELDLRPIPSTAESFALTHQSLAITARSRLTRRDALMLAIGATAGIGLTLAAVSRVDPWASRVT